MQYRHGLDGLGQGKTMIVALIGVNEHSLDISPGLGQISEAGRYNRIR